RRLPLYSDFGLADVSFPMSFVTICLLFDTHRFVLAFAGATASDCDEVLEDGLRQQVVLPADFRVPLNAENELLRTHIDDRFDDAVGSPGDGFKVATDNVYRLMVMTVDRRVRRAGQPGNQRVFRNVDG